MNDMTQEQRVAIEWLKAIDAEDYGPLTDSAYARTILELLPSELTDPQPAVTQAEVDAYGAAWEAQRQAIGRGIAPKGTKTRAGLRAAFAERDRRVNGTDRDN